MSELPKFQRVAAYAVITRGLTTESREILLCRVAPRISASPMWTFPGGGIDHGEDPADGLRREVWEETGLEVMLSTEVRAHSAHMPAVWRNGRRVDAHAVRFIYDGWVAADAPEPRVMEVDGSTVEARWHRLEAVRAGEVPVWPVVAETIAVWHPHRLQRVAAYAVITRGESVLLTRLSQRAHHAGQWTLPGGGLRHGESPEAALVREVAEECGVECTPGHVVTVHDTAFTGVAPSGRTEEFHGLHLVFAATVPEGAEPRLAEEDGTTDRVAWCPIADVRRGAMPVLDVVGVALDAALGE